MRHLAALAPLEAAARAAGEAALAYFRKGAATTARVSFKAGDSPVSEADLAANAVIEARLRAAFPDAGWISEESERAADEPSTARILIVDPIDGTRAFIAGDPQWCVSVALVENRRPVAGVIHAPALGVTFRAAFGHGAFRDGGPISVSRREALADATIAGPRPLLDRLAQASGQAIERATRTPSLALRLARAADATFDLAVASDGAHDWDIAAADIILAEAGAVLVDADGAIIRYGGQSLRRGLMAAGSPKLARAAVGLIGLRS
jgi:myo-inositol-1(or 4)-monophosphatase